MLSLHFTIEGRTNMKKILKATLCLALAVVMGISAPMLTALIQNHSVRELPDGLEAAYLPEEEDDYSGLAADPQTFSFDLGASVRGTSLAYSSSGYTTHTSKGTKLALVKDKTVNGIKCSGMQGMNVGTTYIYTAKIESTNDSAVAIYRTHAEKGTQVVMSYYSSLTATKPSTCTTLAHANELTVVTRTENGKSVNYMYAITCGKNGTPSLARLKIDGTKLYFTGYFQFMSTKNNKIYGGGVRGVRHANGYFYFLVKSGMSFYSCRIPDGANGGTKNNATAVTCYRLFDIDTRNAMFVSSSKQVSRIEGIENWINQGFGYSSDQKAIYVPIFNGKNDNVILIYDVSDYVTPKRLDSKTETRKPLFPSVETLRITDKSLDLFEIESCGFRTGQGTTGDRRMYFNTNASGNQDAVWRIDSFKRKNTAPTPMTDSNSITYTVLYEANYNNPTGSTERTYHIKGISLRLRANGFTRKGYSFIGWTLKRKLDGKWLYFTADGSAKWYLKGTQPAKARLAVYEDGRKVSALTGVNGDTVTCYAQWRPNATGTKSYYIAYDANGGKGSMADTKVVYGTSTAIRTNTFTREGYTFGGWNAYRMSDNSWIYTNNSTGADKWIPVGESTAGYTLKVYRDGCKVAKTSSTDRDMVTFYAVWRAN